MTLVLATALLFGLSSAGALVVFGDWIQRARDRYRTRRQVARAWRQMMEGR